MHRSGVGLRRNGRPQACEPCRKSKHRCDHHTPVCNRCIARGRSDSCVYHPAPTTKTRELNAATPKMLPSLRAARRLPSMIENVPVILPLSPLTYGSPQTTLFRRPGPQHATTSFSAVFRENHMQMSVDLPDSEDEELDVRVRIYDDPARMKLATQTLQDFPSYETCGRLLVSLQTMYDPWLSPKMINHCLTSVWSTFGDDLNNSTPSSGLSSMARELFINGENAASPDDDQPWVNWYSGSSLRWEMIGILFTFFGLSMMHLQDWDPIFSLPEQHGRLRKSASQRMKECADVCLSLRNTDHPTNDLVVCLLKNSGKLYSQIAGDECDDIAKAEGLLITSYIEAGLHRLAERRTIDSRSEFRRTLAASGYFAEKSAALFKARPPALSRLFCCYQPPLDLTESELYGSPEDLVTAVSQLDKDGWNTHGHISTSTWVRARCMMTPIREEILEISLGINIQVPPGKLDQLVEDLSVITSLYPPWIQYCNISQWSRPPFSSESTKNLYIVTRIQAEILQTRFLLERLKQTSSSRGSSQNLFNVAQELMEITLSLWRDRDRFYVYQSAFHWMAVDFGIPAAGILCVELLYTSQNPHASDTIKMSRTATIQSLVMFVALLDWVRSSDGNYKLCRRLKNVIQSILHRILEPKVPEHPEESENSSSPWESITTSQFDPNVPDLSDPDWMNLLNTMDWTQGFGTEMTL